MAGERKLHRHDLPVKQIYILHVLLNPARVALVGSATVATLYPHLAALYPHLAALLHRARCSALLAPLRLPYLRTLLRYAPSMPRLYAASLAFLLILTVGKMASHLRWLALRILLKWQGWIFQMNSLRTKVAAQLAGLSYIYVKPAYNSSNNHGVYTLTY